MAFLFTSEAGLSGHPDKVADLIGDAILDAFLAEDPGSRVGCQVMVTDGLVVVGGQISTTAKVDIESIVRDVLSDIGYKDESEGMSATSQVIIRVDPQSREIGDGVDRGGAGDSAIVIGYACQDTPELMPMPASSVHAIARTIDEHRKSGAVPWLRPDGKIQVTIEYTDGRPRQVHNVIISVQHGPINNEPSLDAFAGMMVRASLPSRYITNETQLLTRANVAFSIGGPKADCGLSGRKVISDTYGGFARHGGGGLSGKDPTKIDRCGMYAARYIAKNLVAAGLADRCEVQLAYMIGHSEPVAINVDSCGSGRLSNRELIAIVRRIFPLSTPAIIDHLRLRRPIYRNVGLYGHFGHEEPEFTWEMCDLVDEIRRVI